MDSSEFGDSEGFVSVLLLLLAKSEPFGRACGRYKAARYSQSERGEECTGKSAVCQKG